MKKVTNKILIITSTVIILFVVISSLIFVKKINDQTIYECLPEQGQLEDATSSVKVHFFDSGFIKVDEEQFNKCEEKTVTVECTSDSNGIVIE
ncbi:MAG: hypothetical protein PHC83_05310 [Bacteroidales bacterium]|nr:hypothetical protein [Bacteroidales bacterium]MDD4208728.1 hypothetical protein [Bacteroidales bacterium]